MSALSMIGLFYVIFATATFTAAALMVFGVGCATVVQCVKRGWKEIQLDVRDQVRVKALMDEARDEVKR